MSHAIASDAPSLSLDQYGILRCGDKWVALPRAEQTVMELLMAKFGLVVSGLTLNHAVWPDRESAPAYRPLNVLIFRLRKRIAPVGLAISTIRTQGFLLHWTETV